MKNIINITICLILLPVFSYSYSKYIVIDPGHDYEDAVSGERTYTEVNTNWAVANKLMDDVYADPDIDWDVELTRTENENDGVTKTLAQRAAIANSWEDLYHDKVYFLSIHCNAGNGNASGTESFYCNNTFNSDDQLLQRYANNINRLIIEYGQMHDRKRCVEDYTYYKNTSGVPYHLGVLKNLRMPNCLNEIGFVDNYFDSNKLLWDDYREKFAIAYLDAFKATFSDIEVVNYSFVNLPCFSNNQYLTRINVTVKNVTNHNFSGDIRAVLRRFPLFELDMPSSYFCQLGNSQYVSLSPGQQTTLSFSANIPYTTEVGMALCVEAEKTSTYSWENVPTPNHRRIIKVPINGAVINGVVYNSSYDPIDGVDIWTYQLPALKSAYLYSDVFDPTTAVTDGDGKYDILIPSDWGEAVVSVRNDTHYDEQLISPVVNSNLTHHYTTSPAVIGVGSGTGSSCSIVSGQSPDDPRVISGSLEDFNYLGANGQPEVAFIKANEQIKLGGFPSPINYSATQTYACGGSTHSLLIYFSENEAFIPNYAVEDNQLQFQYFVSICEVDGQNNQIGNEQTKEVNQEETSWVLLLKDIDFKSILNSMNVQLVSGKRYRLRLGYNDIWTNPDHYVQKEVILSVYSTDLILEDPNIKADNYSAESIILKNANVSSSLELQASNSVKILPQTSIPGNFHALIGTNLKSTSILANSKKNNEHSDKSAYDTEQNLDLGLSNRFVSTLPDVCPCEIKNEEIPDDDVCFTVYPNPVIDKLNIEFSSDFSGKIEILDLNGRLLKQTEINGLRKLISVDDLLVGEYVIKVDNGLNTSTAMFIKD